MPARERRTDRRLARAVKSFVGQSPTEAAIASDGIFQGQDGRMYVVEPEELLMPDMGPPIRIDPGVAIMEEIARSASYVRYLEGKVKALTDDELVWQKSSEISEERSGGPGGGYSLRREENKAEISQWWAILERERRHLAQVANAAVRSGIEERRVRLAERGIDILESAVIAAIMELGHDPNDSRVRQIVGTRLRQAIEGGEVIDAQIPATVRVSSEVLHDHSQHSHRVKPVDF